MKLPLLSSKEICKFLEKENFHLIRQKGSHRFYRHSDGRSTVVPMHSNKDISRGLLKAILNEIKMEREEFLKKYK
ncbi:MAG TPA: type II toxin-antitoxin system HicA family toxin [Candidatus Nanoarchaeia archaeon]|nr:type II toxin-antitoxin system HicA family toxin [Candidatus Nanoarchaeia archaeon]